jgi:hypothetical protein
MALEDTEYWLMTLNRATRSIELDWKDATSAMSGDDFKEALEHLAAHIRDQSATGTLIDLRTFHFAPTPELDAWRREEIVPAYNAGGLKRFAYLLPEGADYQPGGGGEGDEFVTDWFESPDEARAWLKQA